MKNFRSLSLLICVLIFGLNSCQKPIDFPEGAGPGGGKKPGTSFMKAKVDGKWVECTLASAQLIKETDAEYIQIFGNRGIEGFSLSLQPYTGVGTYDMATHIATYMKDATENGYVMSVSGTVKITSATSKSIKGTFEFKGQTLDGSIEKNITEGSFEVSLEWPAGPTPGATDKSLTAKVDNKDVSFVSQAHFAPTTLGNTLSIIGTNGVKSLVLIIFDFKGVGTYDIENDLAQCSYNEDQSQTGSFMGNTGKITITSYSGGILKGTFSFVAPNEDFRLTTKVTITDGKFEIKL